MQSPEETIRLSTEMQDFWKNLFPDASGRWTIDMYWFRSLLHLPLYFLLGAVVGFAIHNFWIATGICCLAAFADETLKIFLPTREFQAMDIGFDVVGFMLGIGIISLLRLLKARFINFDH